MKKEEMAQFAYDSVPFYMKVGNEESCGNNVGESWNQVPCITKSRYINSDDSNLSVRSVIRGRESLLKRYFSIGASGKCVEYYWNIEEKEQAAQNLWMYRERYYKITEENTYCYFYTTLQDATGEVESVNTEVALGFNLSMIGPEELQHICETMLQFHPDWLLLQPSIARLILSWFRNYSTSGILPLRYIELVGEMVEPEFKEELENYFHCPVAVQYSVGGIGAVAIECPCHHMHIINENAWLEVVNEMNQSVEGQEGELYVTSCINRASPWIRFETGDRGIILSGNGCHCGNQANILEITSARKNDYILNSDGTRCTPDVFARAVMQVDAMMDQVIKQFHIIQKGYNRFLAEFVVDTSTTDDFLEAVSHVFIGHVCNPALSKAHYEFDIYETMFPVTADSVRGYFESRMNETE